MVVLATACGGKVEDGLPGANGTRLGSMAEAGGGTSADDDAGGSQTAEELPDTGGAGSAITPGTGGRTLVDATGGGSAADSPSGSAVEDCGRDTLIHVGTIAQRESQQLSISDCERHAVYYPDHEDEWSWTQETDSQMVARSSVRNMVNAWAYCTFRVPVNASALIITFEGGRVTIDPDEEREISGGGLSVMTYEGCSTPAAAQKWGDTTGEETFYKPYALRPDWNRQLAPEEWTVGLTSRTGLVTIALALVDAWEAVPVTVVVDGIQLSVR